MARRHYENFPVASRLVPAAMRPHIAAVYAFARAADDFADEGSRSNTARLALLDGWGRLLHDAAADASGDRAPAGEDSTAGAIFLALGHTIRTCRLEVQLFDDLLSAFRQDVLIKRYDTWEDLLDYCRRSANPVGRLVLRIAGYRDAARDGWSDAVCTALQLTNFWQDLGRDWQNGRVYVPQALLRASGAREDDLARRTITAEWQAALRAAAAKTRDLFDAGRPVADSVTGRLRWELRATWIGGVRILDALDRTSFDVFHRRPALDWRDAGAIAWKTMNWHAS
jgi:phytoene synthase